MKHILYILKRRTWSKSNIITYIYVHNSSWTAYIFLWIFFGLSEWNGLWTQYCSCLPICIATRAWSYLKYISQQRKQWKYNKEHSVNIYIYIYTYIYIRVNVRSSPLEMDSCLQTSCLFNDEDYIMCLYILLCIEAFTERVILSLSSNSLSALWVTWYTNNHDILRNYIQQEESHILMIKTIYNKCVIYKSYEKQQSIMLICLQREHVRIVLTLVKLNMFSK